MGSLFRNFVFCLFIFHWTWIFFNVSIYPFKFRLDCRPEIEFCDAVTELDWICVWRWSTETIDHLDARQTAEIRSGLIVRVSGEKLTSKNSAKMIHFIKIQSTWSKHSCVVVWIFLFCAAYLGEISGHVCRIKATIEKNRCHPSKDRGK